MYSSSDTANFVGLFIVKAGGFSKLAFEESIKINFFLGNCGFDLKGWVSWHPPFFTVHHALSNTLSFSEFSNEIQKAFSIAGNI